MFIKSKEQDSIKEEGLLAWLAKRKMNKEYEVYSFIFSLLFKKKAREAFQAFPLVKRRPDTQHKPHSLRGEGWAPKFLCIFF